MSAGSGQEGATGGRARSQLHGDLGALCARQSSASAARTVGRNLDRTEQLDQAFSLALAQAGGNFPLMVPIRFSELAHQSFAPFGQIESAGPLVVGGRPPSRDATMFEIIEQGNKICATYPHCEANVLLLKARVSFDDGQDAVLYGTDIEAGKSLQEVAKHGELGLPEGIPNKVGKTTEIDRFKWRIRGQVRQPSWLSCLGHQPVG